MVSCVPLNNFFAEFFEAGLDLCNIDIFAPRLLALARGLLALLRRQDVGGHGGCVSWLLT